MPHRIHLGRIFAGGQPQRFEFLQALEAIADGAVIGQGTAQPAFLDEGHAAACRLPFNRFLGLALRADEQNEAPFAGQLGQVPISPQQATDRFP